MTGFGRKISALFGAATLAGAMLMSSGCEKREEKAPQDKTAENIPDSLLMTAEGMRAYHEISAFLTDDEIYMTMEASSLRLSVDQGLDIEDSLSRLPTPAVLADGTVVRHRRGVLHSITQPAVVYPDGTAEWWRFGEPWKEREQTPITPWTSGETAALRQIFGPEMDFSSVKKLMYPEDAEYRDLLAFVPLHDTLNIFFVGKISHYEDYAESVYALWLLIHETTHVVQGKKEGPRSDYCETYHYQMKDGMVFEDFCCEQQASMTADYYMLFLHEKSVMPLYAQDNAGEDALETAERLKNIVESQFPYARASREQREAQEEYQRAHSTRPRLQKVFFP